MNKIVIIEEVAVLRSYACSVVNDLLARMGPLQILEAKDGTEGINKCRNFGAQMVILDTSLSYSDGLTIAQELWLMNRRTKVVFWVQSHKDGYLPEITRTAPHEAIYGYVLKTEPEEKLKYAIASVFIHNNQYTDPVAKRVANRPMDRTDALTDAEFETLMDVALGLTDRAIANRRGLTIRGVQHRLATLSLKIMRTDHWRLKQPQDMEIFNPRTRLVLEAIRRGYIRPERLEGCEKSFQSWLEGYLAVPAMEHMKAITMQPPLIQSR
ncbi:MAG TPA: response regulator [Candidatus Obscuribacterales bacterium]